jgi:hypothetical protein
MRLCGVLWHGIDETFILGMHLETAMCPAIQSELALRWPSGREDHHLG